MEEHAPKLSQSLMRRSRLGLPSSSSPGRSRTAGRILSLAFVRGCETLVAGGDDGVVLWNLAGETPRWYSLGEPVAPRESVLCLSVSADQEHVAAGGTDRCLRLWRARVGNKSGSGERVHGGGIRGVSFSGDGHLLATGSEDKTVKLWSVPHVSAKGQSGKKFLWCARGHRNWVNGVSMARSGARVASCSDDKTVRLWDVGARVPLQVWRDHTDSVRAVQWFGEHCVVAGAKDRTINIWDARTGRGAIQHYVAHSAAVNSVDVHPLGGYYMLSASDDNTVRVWDIREGRLLYTLHAHTKPVNQVRFSADGTRFVSGGDDGAVMAWETRFAGSCVGGTGAVAVPVPAPIGRGQPEGLAQNNQNQNQQQRYRRHWHQEENRQGVAPPQSSAFAAAAATVTTTTTAQFPPQNHYHHYQYQQQEPQHDGLVVNQTALEQSLRLLESRLRLNEDAVAELQQQKQL